MSWPPGASASRRAAPLVAGLLLAQLAARDDERQRLRRDLHDSVGPRLAGMAMQLDAVTDRLRGLDPELAEQARWLGAQLRETTAELRRVLEDLRPSALDDLGLIGALRQVVGPFGDVVTLEAPAERLELPAAVEVAAFRIAAEALTNAVRHSGCQRCCLTVRREGGWLLVEAADDGRGLASESTPGVGLGSMRERAGRAGGRLEVLPRPGGGTLVRVRLPATAGAADGDRRDGKGGRPTPAGPRWLA